MALATKVAERHKEGGFLGVGGTRVGEHEQAAIRAIEEALGGAAEPG